MGKLFGWRETIDKAIDKVVPVIDQAVVDKDAAFKAKFELEHMRTQLMLSGGSFSITKWTICALKAISWYIPYINIANTFS